MQLILSLSKLCPCISWNWTSLVGMYISLRLFTKIWMWWVGLWVAFGKLCIQKCKVGFISWCCVDLLKIAPKPHWLARWFLGLILITWCKSFCVHGSTIIHMSNNVTFKTFQLLKGLIFSVSFSPWDLRSIHWVSRGKKMKPIITWGKDLGGRCYWNQGSTQLNFALCKPFVLVMPSP